ncbi:MAG: hypothetical protein ACRC57_10040 [Sarcina sp.]
MKVNFFKSINVEHSDERIEKQTNELYFKAYFITQIIAIISLGQFASPLNKWWYFNIQFLVLVIFNIYTAIKLKANNLEFKSIFTPQDECILEIRNKIFKKSYLFMFKIILLIEFIIVVFVLNPYINIFISKETPTQIGLNIISFALGSVAIWFIPALYVTLSSIKRGLFVKQVTSDNKNKKNFNKKKFRLRCFYMGIFFSMFQFITKPIFTLPSILGALFAGIFFGVFFYFAMIAMMKLGEHMANKNS